MREFDPAGNLFADRQAGVSRDDQGRLKLHIEDEPKRSSHEDRIIQECVDAIISGLSAIAHTFKLGAFLEERETRLIFKAARDGPELGEVKLRAVGENLVPYIEMKPRTGVLPIRRVIIGPASKSFGQTYALKILLEQFGHLNVEV